MCCTTCRATRYSRCPTQSHTLGMCFNRQSKQKHLPKAPGDTQPASLFHVGSFSCCKPWPPAAPPTCPAPRPGTAARPTPPAAPRATPSPPRPAGRAAARRSGRGTPRAAAPAPPPAHPLQGKGGQGHSTRQVTSGQHLRSPWPRRWQRKAVVCHAKAASDRVERL